MKKIGKNGIGKLIEMLKEDKQEESNIKIETKPVVMDYVKEEYMKWKKSGACLPTKVKKYFSYSILRKECDRELYYLFTMIPDEANIARFEVQLNMKVGEFIHNLYEQHLFPAVKLVKPNYKEPFLNKQLIRDGKVINLLIKTDFHLPFDNEYRTIDIKTMKSKLWNFFKKSPIKYLAGGYGGKSVYLQGQFYMLVADVNKHTIIAHNKDTSNTFELTILRDNEYINQLIDRCFHIKEYLIKKEIPNRKYFDKTICRKKYCDFTKICWKSNGKEKD